MCWFSTIGVAQHKNKTEVRELKLNLSRSTVRWKAEKIGGFHEGSLNFSSGEMKVENYSIKGGKFEIDMNSLTCTDIKDKSLNQKLINHLRSDDFFSIEKYPKAIFEIIQVVPNPRAEAAGNNYLVKGKLTIKGITQEIEFPATITFKDKGGITAFGDLKLDRTRWNIRYGSGKFFDNLGDKLIYDEFSVSFLIIAE
ncbi:MAG: YceI family protein [Bacteroidia bacterium]|nr:YceI family protein [Bacteroidia bacterium]